VADANPPLFDAVALLVFYRRLICDWSEFAADLATLQQLLADQLLSGEQAALFAVQALVFPLPPHLHLYCSQSLAAATSRAAQTMSHGANSPTNAPTNAVTAATTQERQGANGDGLLLAGVWRRLVESRPRTRSWARRSGRGRTEMGCCLQVWSGCGRSPR